MVDYISVRIRDLCPPSRPGAFSKGSSLSVVLSGACQTACDRIDKQRTNPLVKMTRRLHAYVMLKGCATRDREKCFVVFELTKYDSDAILVD